MKANILVGQNSKPEDNKSESTSDPISGKVVRASRSDDGNSICFTDDSGKSIYVKLPSLEPAMCGTNHDVRTFSYRPDRCPCCGCIYDHFCGMRILIDPRTGGLCPHH